MVICSTFSWLQRREDKNYKIPGTKALFEILGFGFLRELPVLKKQMCVCVCDAENPWFKFRSITNENKVYISYIFLNQQI